MTGAWTKRQDPNGGHVCQRPDYSPDVHKGDEWTCHGEPGTTFHCGKVWVVKDLITPDQREPDLETSIWWEPKFAQVVARDNRPHSRACGIVPHPHGDGCHPTCPVCHGAG